MPAYADVLRRAAAAAAALGGVAETLGELEGSPLLRLEFGRPGATALLIDAGLHGEEPAAVLGLLAWLETRAAAWRDRLAFTVLPCLNPFGFARGVRRGRDAEDLNRHFDEPDHPLTRLVDQAVAGRRYALAMDLHEDCDFVSVYCYELRVAPPFLGERILRAAARTAPLSHDDEVGEYRTRHGLIRPPDPAARLARRIGWPIAYALFRRATAHVITLESPGRLPLESRVTVQGDGLDEACAFLAEQPQVA